VRTYQTASPKNKKMEKKMDILEKIDTKLSDKLNESSSGTSLIKIADSFTRYLIGDRNIAISELKKNQPMPIPGLESMSAKEYNNVFQKLHSEIFKAIRQLPAMKV
jgi:hypothetical protein